MNSPDESQSSHPRVAAAERRGGQRSPVIYRLDITDVSNQQIGYLKDLTVTGMRVRCNPGVDMAEINSLVLLFPKWMGIGEQLKVTGRFVWTKPVNEGRTEGGFLFESLRAVQLEALESVIDSVIKAATEDELL